jgi:ATP-dependent Lon protease
MNTLDQKLLEHFPGRVVRKDLTKLVKGNVIVPSYVLEYLLGQYCATDDEETILNGVESVKRIIARHFVHRDQSEMVKHEIREKGSHQVIDKVVVQFNERKDMYEATFINLNLKKVEIDADTIRSHPKLLVGGVWCIARLSYMYTENKEASPWIIDSLKPIQNARISLEEYLAARKHFTAEEWIDVLIQTIGFNPEHFSRRSKLLQLARLIPFAENNYNLIELGPKGTGKSHIFSEMSPHGILISGGEVTRAKLFVNNSNGNIGLVGYWDVVAYDEFAGRGKRVDRGLVDIMKNYMANKSFSRGTEVYGAAASMAFVGNTDHSVHYMLRHADLFEALPDTYHDPAFLDRLHAYLPGWEVEKLRNEMFTSGYGFIVDYLAEVLKELRREDYMQVYRDYYTFSDSLTTRDRDAIGKTLSGLIKLIYPHGDFSRHDLKELLEFAMECRKRVKDQLIKMDETFEAVEFVYQNTDNGKKNKVECLENLEYAFKMEEERPGPASEEDGSEVDGEVAKEQVTSKKKARKHGDHILIKENQKGVNFRRLFGEVLQGAHEIHLFDPYLRAPWQIKNLLEFCQMLLLINEPGEEIQLKVYTKYDEFDVENERNTRNMLQQLSEQFEGTDLRVEVEFDMRKSFHDRMIETDTGWTITLGRGLDIYKRYDYKNIFAVEQNMPEARSCYEFSVTYHQKEAESDE